MKDLWGLLDLSHCLTRKLSVIVCGSQNPLRSTGAVLSWSLGALLLQVSHKPEPKHCKIIMLFVFVFHNQIHEGSSIILFLITSTKAQIFLLIFVLM